MKKTIFIFLFCSLSVFSQTVKENLDKKTKNFLASSGMEAGNLSFYVCDEKGNFIYEYQGNKGLSTASTQKIFTAAAALETLGKDFKFITTASYSGSLNGNILNGDLVIFSNGDPTLGSWRYENFKPENFKQKFLDTFKELKIKEIKGNIFIDDSYFDFQTTPGGWRWDDMGNYYGAGIWGVNWRENQFDVNFTGTKIKSFSYPLENVKWVNELKEGGNGDNSVIYTAPHTEAALVNGSLPAGKETTVSGATPNPPLQLGVEIYNLLKTNGIQISGKVLTASNELLENGKKINYPKTTLFLEYQSPALEKIIYWFLRKSVNLYGETLLKTMAKQKRGDSNFENGVKYLKNFWTARGIPAPMINFADGSGLSPQNYVSARAEALTLIWAKKQTWFPVFYDALPTLNGMKMKSGTIKDCKAFAGYHNGYVFSILVNNYQGNNLQNALFGILNTLK